MFTFQIFPTLLQCNQSCTLCCYFTLSSDLKNNDKAKQYLARLQKRMSKAKALSALAHKIGRCIYFMLKNQQVFDEARFLKG